MQFILTFFLWVIKKLSPVLTLCLISLKLLERMSQKFTFIFRVDSVVWIVRNASTHVKKQERQSVSLVSQSQVVIL